MKRIVLFALALEVSLLPVASGQTNLITAAELGLAKGDWPKSVTTTTNISVGVTSGQVVIPKGEVLPVVSVSNTFVSIIYVGSTNQIPTAATDIVEQINALRCHRLLIGKDQYDYTRIEPINPVEAKVFHRAGIAVMPMATLPAELQKQLGYDPQKATEWIAARQSAQAEVARKKAEWERLRQAAREAEYKRIREANAGKYVKIIPYVGDETPVEKIIAEPRAAVGKTLILCGSVSLENYYNYAYAGAAGTHYSLIFWQWSADMNATASLTVYALRSLAKPLIDILVADAQAKGPNKLVRLKITVTPRSFQGGEFNENVELVDWQILNRDKTGWSSWATESKR